MAFVHGKNTFISLNAVDLSAFTDASELTRNSDIHDVTTYGKQSHVKVGGLLDGKGSMSGTYDNAVGGPRGTIEPLIGTNVTLIRRPEGTGTGRPQDSVNVVVGEYVETNPVADMVKWSVALELSDEVTSTSQP
ncbi:hypothetical protein [Kribbella catacumbae]|uniref:hypothetical protein n=1 Tax=Kribbella catacumbae TaxID=460086 RepID=UPI00035F586E|nr:hypothetical protein [Kribbella catacumbae]